MLRRILSNAALILLAAITAANAAPQDYLSPVAMAASRDGKIIYTALFTAKKVAVFDVGAKRISRTISLDQRPNGIALSPDETTMYVTGGEPAGLVFVIDTKKGKVTNKIKAGHTPGSPVVSPDGKALYVCNRFNGDVSVIEIASGKETGRIPVGREPVSAAITMDGRFLFVANHLPAGPADADYVSATVSVIDLATGKACDSILLPNGSTGVRGVCLSPDGKHVYVTHILARYGVPTTQIERGWMNTNALTIIDAAERKLVNTVLLDNVDLGAANPWAVTCTADGKYVCVTHAGTHEVSLIDRAGLHEKLERVKKGENVSSVSQSPENVPNDLSFLVGMRRRLKLCGNGPRAIVAIGATVYVAEYFTDTLCTVDINPEAHPFPESIALGVKVGMDTIRKGEMFFNDAELCFQHWQSCASCHPDARADGLNWDLLNDGMGNPKQTKSLVLSHKTPPVMVTGVRDRAETAVRAGIRFIQFAVRPEEDACALDEYLKSLLPVESPYLVNGQLSAAARRGEKLFGKAGCAGCHPAPLYTGLGKHDLGLGKDLDQGVAFDTPTLIENWRTAPFLHDGRAATMKDVLTTDNPGNCHGETSDLTPEEIDDLTIYNLSL